MNLKAKLRKLWEMVTREGRPFRCASCKGEIADPDAAFACEVCVDFGDEEPEPTYVACCCELCLQRVQRRGLGPIAIAKVVDEE